MPDDDKTRGLIVASLLASGFPFQTAVARLVHTSVADWSLSEQEFPFRDEDGSDKFLDVVAHHPLMYAMIECKRTLKETYTFLQPGGADHDVISTRCLALEIPAAPAALDLFSTEWSFKPKSQKAAFCVVGGNTSGNKRLLEDDAQLLVRATDAFARHHLKRFPRRAEGQSPIPYIPILATTAELFIAEYEYADITMEAGQFDKPPTDRITKVPWVRFTKTFTSAGADLGERTVFVVHAHSLREFLGGLASVYKPDMEGKVSLPRQY